MCRRAPAGPILGRPDPTCVFAASMSALVVVRYRTSGYGVGGTLAGAQGVDGAGCRERWVSRAAGVESAGECAKVLEDVSANFHAFREAIA